MKFNRLQRIVKGFANHRRIQILEHLFKNNGISLNELSGGIKVNLKTVSEHTRKMVSAGLISKHYKGAEVQHLLTTRGKRVLKFLQNLEK